MATRKFRAMRYTTIAAVAACGLALGACGGGGGTSGGAAPTVGGEVSGELNILVSSATGSDAGFKAVTKEFTTKHPNVKVNFSAVPNENYNQTRSSRLTAGSVDIVVAFPREVPSYVPAANAGDDARLADSGGFLDLTGQPFLTSFNQSVLDGTKYKGKNYTVPTGLSYYTGMFYNKKIFSDNGITVPTTWQELMAACDKLKAKGIVPVGIAGKDSAGVTTLGVVAGPLPRRRGEERAGQGSLRRVGEARRRQAAGGAEAARDPVRLRPAQLRRHHLPDHDGGLRQREVRHDG